MSFFHALTHALESPVKAAAGWTADHWKTLAVIGVSTVAFVAVTALTGGLGAAPMAALLYGGVASGVTGYVAGGLLDHEKITLEGALVAGAIGGVTTVATAGVLRFAAPALSSVEAPVAASVAGREAVGAVTGSALGAATQVVTNLATGKPLTRGVSDAAVEGGVSGLLVEPATRLVPGRGIVGALEDAELRPTGAPAAEPGPTLESLFGAGARPEDGELLGRGVSKNVYAVDGHPDLAVGVLRKTGSAIELENEQRDLAALAADGFPVADILSVGMIDNHGSYLMRRYALSSQDNDLMTRGRGVLNETTLADLEKIRANLRRSPIEIADFELLVGADGHAYLSDPLYIVPRASAADVSRERLGRALGKVDLLETVTRKLLAAG